MFLTRAELKFKTCDGCNTAIESFQTDRLLRVFHSCYFHYSEVT